MSLPILLLRGNPALDVIPFDFGIPQVASLEELIDEVLGRIESRE